MDLLWQRGGSCAFGTVSRSTGHNETIRRISRLSFFVALLFAGGMLYGGLTAWPVQLMIVMALVVAGFLSFSLYESKRGSLASGNIVITPEKGLLELPQGKLEGTHNLEDFTLVLESDKGPEAINERCWWVALETVMDNERERSFRLRMLLYGPGFKGEMQQALWELERLREDR